MQSDAAKSDFADYEQVAYLMADISNVNNTVIKDLYQRLEDLSCA